MTPDEFLIPVARALLFPPAELLAALDRVSAPGAAPPPLGAASAHVPSALGSLRAMLRPGAGPGSAPAVIALDGAGAGPDMMAIRWTARDGAAMTAVLTASAVAVWSAASAGPATADDALEAAQALFALPADYAFARWGGGVETGFGGRDPARGAPADPEWPHWRDELRWWRDGARRAFVTLRAAGGPTRAVISFGPEDNADWF